MAYSTTAIGSAYHSISRVPAGGLHVGSTPCGSTSRCVVQLSSRRFAASSKHESWRRTLSWTASNAFGTATDAFKFSSYGASYAAESGHSLTVIAFTPEQSKMVKESWKMLQKDDAGKHALKFFLKIFEIAPSVKRFFPFLQDSSVPLEKNPKLKTHALQVFVLTGQSAAELGQKGALDALRPKLLELGHTHVGYGVVEEHFDVVKFALLLTLAEALPDKWNAELKEAWAVAYDEVVYTIKEEMKVVRQRQAGSNLVAA